eukprot:s6213_g6.t1
MASGMEGLQLLQGWTTALWGEPIRLQNDLEATILWDAPTAVPAPTEDEMEALDLCRPAGAAGDQPRREKPEEMDSWDTGELPGTDTEEEAWGLTRRRRRSFGFVCFATPDDATKAVTEMHLKVVKGKPLYVGLAERKEARQERLRQRYVGAPGTSYKGGGGKGGYGGYGQGFKGKGSKDGMGIPTNMEAYSSQGMMMNMGGMGAMGGMGMPGMGGMMRPPMMGMMQPPMQAMNNAMPKFGKGGFDGGGGGGMMPNQMAMKGMPPSGKGMGMGPMPMNAMGPMGGGMMRPPQPCGMQQMMRPNPPQPTSGPPAVSGPVQKQMIGEKLYPLVAKYQPEWAGKITGMMLEMDNSELLMLLESESQLRGKVDEAVRVIQSAREAYCFCVRLNDSETASRRVRIERLPTFNGLSKQSCGIMLLFGSALPYAMLLVLNCGWLLQMPEMLQGIACLSQAHPKLKRTVPAVGRLGRWSPDSAVVIRAEHASKSLDSRGLAPGHLPITKRAGAKSHALSAVTAASWLDLQRPFKEIISNVLKVSQAHAQSELFLYEVSPLVSNIRNESPDCLLPKKKYDEKQLSKGIGRFFKPKTDTGSLPALFPEFHSEMAS